MVRLGLAPPTPEVQYLPTLFRRVETGEIRIPAFQRRFVWAEAQVLALLQSIYDGFPIGNLLFWKVATEQLQIQQDGSIPFPDVPVHYPLSFVLDGMQRLSSLFGVFHWQDGSQPDSFNVLFDLRNQSFKHYKLNELPSAYIRLSALFSPKRLLETQRWLAEQDDGDALIDRSITLHSIFQEYLIPTVTITDRSVDEVVQIFERINSTGLRLSAVDFMRALTWSTEFDLNKAIFKLREAAVTQGFRFPSETLVKVLSVVLGKAPTPDGMLTLRDFSSEQLHSGVEECLVVLKRVIDFLNNDFKIMSYDFVPYEGQILVLTKLFQCNPSPVENILAVARRWFWSISFSEGLRGKPADVVTRAINNAEKLAGGDLTALEYRLNLSPADFVDRRLIRNKALSSAIAAMFAVNGARSLVDGQLLSPKNYMVEFTGKDFEGLYKLESLREVFDKEVQSRKLLANILVASENDLASLDLFTPEQLMFELEENFPQEIEAILKTQFLDSQTLTAIKNGNTRQFLEYRAGLLFEAAKALSSNE